MKKFFSKNINRAIVFLCIAAMCVAACCHFLGFADGERSNTVMDQFYELEENSAECIFFGSSVTQRDYITPVAYHEFGVPAYLIATGTQPFVLTKYLMEEALKTQSPKLFVVELKGANKAAYDLGDSAVRKVIDNMKPSLNKYRAIKALTEYAKQGENEIDKSGMSYYFPLLKYHSRWNPSLNPKNFEDVDYYNGYSPNAELTFRCRKLKPKPYDPDHFMKIDEPAEAALVDLLDYCDTLEDTKVLFVIPPYQASMDGMGKLNYSKSIVESRGYEVLNMLPAEARSGIGLRNRTCYYNREHLNYHGALIYTDFFFRYIMENYGIEDVRGEGGHEIWDSEYDRLMADLQGKYADLYKKMTDKVNRIEGEGK